MRTVDGAALDDLWPAEEIALEVVEPDLRRLPVLVRGLDLLCEQLRLLRRRSSHVLDLLGRVGLLKADLDHVGERDERVQ